jgi:hypothetical protein
LQGVSLLRTKIGFQVENEYSFVHIAKEKTRKLIAFFVPGVYSTEISTCNFHGSLKTLEAETEKLRALDRTEAMTQMQQMI